MNASEHTPEKNIAALCLIIILKIQVQQHDFSKRDQLTCPRSKRVVLLSLYEKRQTEAPSGPGREQWLGRQRSRTQQPASAALFLVTMAALQTERGDSKSLHSGNT